MRHVFTFLLTFWLACTALTPASAQETLDPQSKALQRASDAVVGVQALSVEDARSAATLGRARQGSGVVISDDGLVLTIGYLILEAERVQLLTDDGRRVPARVVAYDLATGFGLLRALAPLKLEPAPLGEASGVKTNDPLMVASGGEEGVISLARLLNQRPFSGYWEYHIEGALFTGPPHRGHSGAGLFNQQGELVGIGSLLVMDALGDPSTGVPRAPGNMFVPVDLRKPVLAELLVRGSSAQSARAWLGINCIEQGGGVRIVRVNDDSPADVAGLQVGDRILRIDGLPVQRLDELWKALWRPERAEREVSLDIQRDGQTQNLKVFSVDRSATLRRPQGV
jgi:serine protease Do